MPAAGAAPLSTPSSAGSRAPCLPVYPRNRGCEPVVLLHNSFHAMQGFSPPASGSRSRRMEESLFSRHRTLPRSTASASCRHPTHTEGGNLTHSRRRSVLLPAQCAGPAHAPREHSTCQWPHAGQGSRSPQAQEAAPELQWGLPTLSLSAPSPPPAQEGGPGQTSSGELPVPPPCLRLPPPLGHRGGQPTQATSVPTCPLFWPRQRVLQQGLEDLRHVHGRGHSNPVTARHGHGPAGGACLGSSEAAREAGAGPGAAGSGGGRGGSPRQPMGSRGPGPPVHPRLGRPPASSGCSQAFPSRCLAGRAWPCASNSTWSHRANPLTEPSLLSNFAKGSSPPGWEP